MLFDHVTLTVTCVIDFHQCETLLWLVTLFNSVHSFITILWQFWLYLALKMERLCLQSFPMERVSFLVCLPSCVTVLLLHLLKKTISGEKWVILSYPSHSNMIYSFYSIFEIQCLLIVATYFFILSDINLALLFLKNSWLGVFLSSKKVNFFIVICKWSTIHFF